MPTSIDTLQPGQQPASPGPTGHIGNTKPLWAAVGILGVAVLGMGGTLIHNQRAPVAPAALVAPAATVASVTAPQQLSAAPAASVSAADDLIEKPVLAPAKPAPAPAPAKKVVKHVAKPVLAPAYSGVSAAPVAGTAPYPGASTHAPVVAAVPVCAVCGSVESVTPVEHSSKPPGVGVGTVAGGVLGAVLGNQVGHGNGRTAATILGAVGGGFAGNAIEGRVRRETVYQVGVRMEDGSRRTVEVAHAPSVGSPVTVQGSTLRTQDGVSYSPRPAAVPVAAQAPGASEYPGR